MSGADSLVVRVDPEPCSGADNMRIDEELLNCAVRSRLSTLRFYQWSQPTVSLGYFQRDATSVPTALAGLPIVRRLSGGGAILHDRELTYSVSLAADHAAVRQPTQLYARIHEAIIEVLGRHGVECGLRGRAHSDPENQSFLCFARADPNDIVLGQAKIVGSAQRRRRGAVLQHGSILLAASPLAPEHKGLLEFGVDLKPLSLAAELQCAVVESLGG